MVGSISNAITGYRAATERLETSANNLANANTTAKLERNGTYSNEPYKPQTVISISQQEGGVTTERLPQQPETVRRFDPTSAVADEEGIVEMPNVDVARELVNQIIASYDAKANLRAIQVQDEVMESTLDIFT